MNKDSSLNSNEVLEEDSPSGDGEYEQDFVLLRYMAQRIYITLYLLDEPADASQPLLYYLEEGHKYTHRIAIYNPQALLLKNKLDFVGFIVESCLMDWPATNYACRKQNFTSSTGLMRSQAYMN